MKPFKRYLIESSDDSWTKDAELLKLTRKALACIAGSQRQKELIKQVNVLRKKYGLEPLKESDEITEDASVDVSSASRLFQKFLRSTGAPDKADKFSPKSFRPDNKIFVATSTNSKFNYVIDLAKGTVTAHQLNHLGTSSYVWDDKTGRVKIAESKLSEESPPDSSVEKWITDNKSEFKKKYGAEKGLEVLYATAWKMYNSKKE